MRTLMRTLTGLLALLVVGATASAAGVSGTLDAAGAGSLDAEHASSGVAGHASASADVPDVPDVDALKAELESHADAAGELAAEGAAEASSEIDASVETTRATANAAAEGGANPGANATETAVEPDTSLFGWLRAKITALVVGVKAKVDAALEDETDLPDVEVDAGAAVDGAVSVDRKGVTGAAEGVLAGELDAPGVPSLPL